MSHFSKLYILGGIINLLLIFILFQFLEEKVIAVSISLLITESIITLGAFLVILNKQIMTFRRIEKK